MKLKIEDCYEKLSEKSKFGKILGKKFRVIFVKNQAGFIVAGEITGP